MSMFNDAVFADYAEHDSGDTLPFYEAEGQILSLWDQLNELKLEQCLYEVQPGLTAELGNEEVTDAQLKEAEKDCLEARTAYKLRQSLIEDVLIADPILKAVHSGVNAKSTERALHPLIDRRDILSIAHTNLISELHSIISSTTITETDNIRTLDQNRERSASLLALTQKFHARQESALAGSDLSAELEHTRNETRIARKRWRIMKSVVGATVAGSGIDWSRNDALRELVLDQEDEAD